MNNRRKLLVGLGAGTLAVMSLLGYLIWLGYQQAIQAAEITTRNYAAIMEARLEATLRRVEADLHDLARTIPIEALSKQAEPHYARELTLELRAHLVNFPELTGLRITDANGERLYTSDSADTPRTQLGDRDYFRLLRDNPATDLVFSEVIISRAGRRPSVVVATALRDGRGAFRGTVFAVIELSHFQKLFQSLDIGPGGIVAFYRSGSFSQVVRWPVIDEELNAQLPPDSPTRKALANGNKTATLAFMSRRDGIARIYSYHALDSYPFFVAVGVAREHILANWRARSLTIGLSGLVLLGLLASLLSRLWRAEARQAQAMAALVQSEGRFRALFDRASEGIIGLSSSGKLVGCNESFARMHGYTVQEMQKLSLKDLDVPETFRLMHERMQRILSGESMTFEVEHYHKDGHVFPLEVSASLISSDGEPLVQAFHRDITERKRAEQAARRQNELAQLLEGLARVTNEAVTPEPALRMCLERICEHGNWTLGHVATFTQGQSAGLVETSFWHRRDPGGRYEEFIGYSDSFGYNVSTGRFTGLALRERRPVWIEDLSGAAGFGRNAVAVKHGLLAGLALPVIVNGEVTAFLEFFAETARPADSELMAVTESVASMLARLIERERALNALREREHLVRMVTEHVPAMISYFDAELRCRFANTAFCEFRRLDPQNVVGKTLREITGEDTYGVIRPIVDRFVKEGKPATECHEERTATGEIRHLEVHRVPEMSPAGAFLGYYAMGLDITERVHAEADRNQLEAQLLEAQKMEAIGTLAGGIAHDFNNILGAIIGNAVLARQDVGAGHRALVSLDEIYKASQRAKDLVQQILTFSRKQPQQLQIRPLGPVVEDAVKLLRSTLPAGVELAASISDIPLYVHADATQIQQVLLNLCTNAWHAMDGRAGRIEIGLETVALDAAAVSTLPGLQAGPHVCLSVSDNGCGMDAATQARIFEPFFTTKAVNRGTGLGLSVVHGIVKAHHGAISLESVPGAGTTFRIYFPAIAGPCAEALPKPAVAGSARGSGQHVLYLDDDEAMVFLVTRMLEGFGYRVSGYEIAEQALAAVRAAPGDFDLVVTDFNMPGLSGLEVAQELARMRPDLPVVITSGYITEELRANAHQAGVRHLIYKPNTVDTLCEIIQRLLIAGSSGVELSSNETIA